MSETLPWLHAVYIRGEIKTIDKKNKYVNQDSHNYKENKPMTNSDCLRMGVGSNIRDKGQSEVTFPLRPES